MPSHFFNKFCFIKKEALAQVFSGEFCKISKNTFFTERLQKTTSLFYNEAIRFTLICLFWNFMKVVVKDSKNE